MSHHNELEKFASRGLKARAAVDEALRVRSSENNLPAGCLDSSAGVSEPRAGGKQQSLPRLNSMPFINRTNVRNFLIEHAKATRPANKFRRVSEETLRDIHEAVRQMLINRVHRTPSKGRTM